MEASHQFILGFREIERHPVGFGECRDHEQQETDDLALKDGPLRNQPEIETSLAIDNLPEAERVQHQQRRGDRHRHGQLIADHLRRPSTFRCCW